MLSKFTNYYSAVFITFITVTLMQTAIAGTKIDPDDVVRLPVEPSKCKFLGFVEDSSVRLTPFTSSSSLFNKIVEVLKDKTADKGGNGFFVNSQNAEMLGSRVEAKAYYCENLDKAPTGDAENKQANGDDVETKTTGKPPEPSRPRPNLTAGVLAKLGFIYLGPGGGITGIFSLTKNIEVNVGLLHSQVEYDDELDSEDSSFFADEHLEVMNVDITELSGHLRWFVAANALPSFNLFWGVGYAYIEGEYGYKIDKAFSSDEDKEVTDSMVAHALLPQIGISNTWVFGPGITFGADWLSVSAPIIVAYKYSDDETVAEAASDGVDFKDRGKKTLGSILLLKTMLSIGWQF